MNEQPKTIDEVLFELDKIIHHSMEEDNFLGVFAFVYRRTTAEIKKEIERKQFEDNKRMEKLDVIFANLYINAYKKNRKQQSVSKSWEVAFDAEKNDLAIIQHVLMGMNAHINLDLGIAASEVMNGKPIEELKIDFNKVNDILFSLTDEMQDRLSKVSFLMFLLDWFGGTKDEGFINFSMKKARAHSWKNAKHLWDLKDKVKQAKIGKIDDRVAGISKIISRPNSILLRFALKLIRFFEEKQIKRIIDGLRDYDEETEPDKTVKALHNG